MQWPELSSYYRWYKEVPYPILGPPGVRRWLLLRGLAGFTGLFGAYYSVQVSLITDCQASVSVLRLHFQFISLSDSTTIGFLAPFVTAVLGYVLLKEPYSSKEAYASSASFLPRLMFVADRSAQSLPSSGLSSLPARPSSSEPQLAAPLIYYQDRTMTRTLASLMTASSMAPETTVNTPQPPQSICAS